MPESTDEERCCPECVAFHGLFAGDARNGCMCPHCSRYDNLSSEEYTALMARDRLERRLLKRRADQRLAGA